jgi:DNA modification methylase
MAIEPFKGAHFATFPTELARRAILAGCPAGGVVLDPFGGAGTTGLVANRLGRDAILIELNEEYADMARSRIRADLGRVTCPLPPSAAAGPLFDVEAA